jgi:hypothetical protein
MCRGREEDTSQAIGELSTGAGHRQEYRLVCKVAAFSGWVAIKIGVQSMRLGCSSLVFLDMGCFSDQSLSEISIIFILKIEASCW